MRISEVLESIDDKYQTESDKTVEAFTPHVYEVHGNVRYMHCSDEFKVHAGNLIKSPTLQEAKAYFAINQSNLVPKCDQCGKNMKPHCMFFDE